MSLLHGAARLAKAEFPLHPEGFSDAILERAVEVLVQNVGELDRRRCEALDLEFVVVDAGDDATPPSVLYRNTGSTGSEWADRLLGRNGHQDPPPGL
jgi:hypothetical protein